MARRRPSTQFCSASSQSPSSSRSSSCRNVLRSLFSNAASSVSRAPRLVRPESAVVTATTASVRRPGYPLDRVGAYVFLKRALELPHSGEGRRSRQRQDRPIANKKDPCALATSLLPRAADPARAGRRWSSPPSSLPAPAHRRGHHPVRHRAELLARHQRIANQGARWAAVATARRSATTPPSYNPCSPNPADDPAPTGDGQRAEEQSCVAITFPSGTARGRPRQGLAQDAVHRRAAARKSARSSSEPTPRCGWSGRRRPSHRRPPCP